MAFGGGLYVIVLGVEIDLPSGCTKSGYLSSVLTKANACLAGSVEASGTRSMGELTRLSGLLLASAVRAQLRLSMMAQVSIDRGVGGICEILRRIWALE